MAISKPKKKPQPTHNDDEDLLKYDVASFASSIGLSSSCAPHSGFDDSDFRKTGRIKKPSKPNVVEPSKIDQNNNVKEKERPPKPKPKPNPRVFPAPEDFKAFDRFKNLPKLPLMKASALAVWHEDAAELEKRVIGKRKAEAFSDGEERKRVVAEKKKLAERLLAQYVGEFESSRGQSRDIKMLITTQRSGTAMDKVSAFSVMVGENPVANLRSLDALLGKKKGLEHSILLF